MVMSMADSLPVRPYTVPGARCWGTATPCVDVQVVDGVALCGAAGDPGTAPWAAGRPYGEEPYEGDASAGRDASGTPYVGGP
jgi:hypothetical protein